MFYDKNQTTVFIYVERNNFVVLIISFIQQTLIACSSSVWVLSPYK